jgi:hypothetical protein
MQRVGSGSVVFGCAGYQNRSAARQDSDSSTIHTLPPQDVLQEVLGARSVGASGYEGAEKGRKQAVRILNCG